MRKLMLGSASERLLCELTARARLPYDTDSRLTSNICCDVAWRGDGCCQAIKSKKKDHAESQQRLQLNTGRSAFI